MVFYQLVVLPTQETVDYIRTQMSPPPFDIDLDKLHVVVLTSRQPIPESAGQIYIAKSKKLDRVYDSQLQRSTFTMSLDSPALQELYSGLVQAGCKDAFYKEFYPHMHLVDGMPPGAPSFRKFRVAMENIFSESEVELEFGNELVMTKDISYPVDSDYQELMNMEVRNGNSFLSL